MNELYKSENGDYATKIGRLLSALPDNQLASFR